MRLVFSLTAGLTMVGLLAAGAASAAELKSGPQAGDYLGAFQVVKAAGAPNDGVKDGDQLCYRCKLGNRPAVMVFARKSDSSLANLVKQLDAVVSKNEEKKMASFVSLLGDKPDDLKTEAKDLIEKTKAEHVAVVVPVDNANGPSEYNINPHADVTVLIYRQGKVAVNHTLAAGQLDDGQIKSIIADTSKILND
jgi:hypothetical protein